LGRGARRVSFSESKTMRLTVSLESRRVTRISRTTGQAATKNFAPGGRRVTGCDGNMVSVDHIGHHDSSQTERQVSNNRTRIVSTGPGGEAVHMSARTPEAEPLLTPAEVATMFRVDPKTVTRWAKAGKLTPSARWGVTVGTGKLRFARCSQASHSSAWSNGRLQPLSPADHGPAGRLGVSVVAGRAHRAAIVRRRQPTNRARGSGSALPARAAGPPARRGER
jgi:hypothetical protein